MNSCTDDILKAMADRLNLTYLRDHIEEIISETSICKMNSREILQFVFKKEIERREENRIRLGIMSAHFPRRCTLNSFDFDVQPSIDMAIIRELKTLSIVSRSSRCRKNAFGHWLRNDGH